MVPEGQRLTVGNGGYFCRRGAIAVFCRRFRGWLGTLIPSMLRPTFTEFQRLAKTATLVPVAKSISADLLTPVSAFLSFAEKEPYSFLLESVEGGEKVGRYTFLGARPYMRLTSDEDDVVLDRGREAGTGGGDARRCRESAAATRAGRRAGLPPFTAGAVGFFSYDMVRRFERLPERAKKRSARSRLRADVLRPPAGL